MVNRKLLIYGSENHVVLKIEISYEWSNGNDELVDSIIEKLPNFIDSEERSLLDG